MRGPTRSISRTARKRQLRGADGDGRQPPRSTSAAASPTSPSRSRCGSRCAAAAGLYPRADVTGYRLGRSGRGACRPALSRRRGICGRLQHSAGWAPDEDGVVRAAQTDFLPAAEVERVEPNERHRRCRIRHGGPGGARSAADRTRCATRSRSSRRTTRPGSRKQAGDDCQASHGQPRQATAQRLIAAARQARDRIAAGIALLADGPPCAARLPGDERGRRPRRPAARRWPGRRSGGAASTRRGGRSSSPSSCSTWPACRTGCTRTAKSSTCCSSRPAAARRKPISASPP